MTVLLILAALAALAALSVLPFVLPWPRQLRWIIANAAIADPLTGLTPPGLDPEEIAIRYVEPPPEGLVHVGRPDSPVSWTVSCAAVDDEGLARLQGWAAAGTPLLKLTLADGEIMLCGPTSSVGRLRPVDPSVALA
jgi:hypothetical protein